MIPIITSDELESEKQYSSILSRELTFDPALEQSVRDIIENVRARGDEAVIEYTQRFDRIELDSIEKISWVELKELHDGVSEAFLAALREAIENVRRFHQKQLRESYFMDGDDGVRLGLRFTPIPSVGLYVPGGAGAYPSSIVMNAVPAQVAGVKRIVVVTPPGQFRDNAHVAAALYELNIIEVYTVGGAQAIAALAYGTDSIKPVDKIVGPGNMYVALAKRQVYGQVDIDMVAGPSEIVVVADESADPAFVAADLLSQAEHGSGMEMALLLTTSKDIAQAVRQELMIQVEKLEHSVTAKRVLDANALVIVKNLDEAVAMVNRIAPEHLELIVNDTHKLLDKITNAGAIFLGAYSPEPISDYYAGPNHVLPTSGAARYASPLGVYDFQKCSNVVEYTEKAVKKCCDKVEILSRAEGFDAHAEAVKIRCRKR
ncbi:MAG: histidinol dehydrogenase [Candidatus Latescibacteria bacterium]|nr:histidinol dehydrogenase [Candidatus Latescibacterota bacterium]